MMGKVILRDTFNAKELVVEVGAVYSVLLRVSNKGSSQKKIISE